MGNAATYERVSTGKQHTENQTPALLAMCSARGWEIVGSYSETASGAKIVKRSQFEAMMESARRGEFQYLVVYSISRLTRKGGIDAILTVQKLSEYGVRVLSHSEPWLDPASPFYATLLAMAGDLAAIERNSLVERTIAGLARARKAGRIGGRPKAVVDRDKIRTRYAAGESQPAIAADLRVSVMTVNRIVRETHA